MRIFALGGFLVVLALTGCAGHPVKTASLVIKRVVYSPNAVIREAIINECDLPSKLSASIKSATESQYPRVEDDPANAGEQADILNVEITHADGAGGGAWTGPKSVAIKATLVKQGKVVGDFKASRIAEGGGYGTCAILQRCTRKLGRDIADWLKNPILNAVLK
jgi:hypothetical protein